MLNSVALPREVWKMTNHRGSTAHSPKTVSLVLCFALSVGTLGMYGGVASASGLGAVPQSNTPIRFRLDSSQSKFIAHGLRGGLLWFKGHEHLVAANDFTGEAVWFSPNRITSASLQLTVKTDSMVETSDVFT